MLDLKACTVCFSVDTKLYSLNKGRLRHEYNLVSGLHTKPGHGLPEFLCVFCSALVRRFIKFREKCQRAHYALQEILHRSHEINKSHLHLFKRKELGIMPPLSYIDLTRSHVEDVKFQWVHHSRHLTTTGDTIPITHCSTLTDQDRFCDITPEYHLNTENNVKAENEEGTCNFSTNLTKQENCIKLLNRNTSDVADGFDDNHEDVNDDYNNEITEKNDNQDNKPDGLQLEEEYASIIPISVQEAKAAVEVYKLFSNGKYKCKVCNKRYHNEERMNVHARMHDKHISGSYHCSLCNYYYKTDYLLQTHMTDKHMYKYVCRKCPEVSFHRISAKQHYIWTHIQKGQKKSEKWYESRPTWLSGKGGRRVKGVVQLRTSKRTRKLPDDFLLYSPIRHEEQYKLVEDRKLTRNYIDSLFKCEFCYRGFRESATYEKHMKKHDPAYAGNVQCDMCKLYFRDLRKLYKHMNITHLFKYSCQQCSYVCVNRGQAHAHYKWHKNVTYSCPHCDKVFKKLSTRLTHVRIKHPSTNICTLCGHSFVSENGLYCHKQIAHNAEEREMCETTPVDTSDPCYCADCGLHFLSDHAFITHLGSSSKHASTNLSIKPCRKAEILAAKTGKIVKKRGRPSMAGQRSEVLNNGISTPTNCEVCEKVLVNDVQARKHYESEHPGTEYLKRYMCDVCGHTTRQYANLMVHMRTHTNEKPYECPHCDRRFSMPSNRDRHLVVHTGEKRYQCQHCNRRFTQSSAVKLHIQTVHLKIPYAPWVKKNRKRRKELEGTSAPVSAVTSSQPCLPTPHKLLLETQGDYLNAYINYSDY